MSLDTLHPIWREALACFEALRRLGFVSDDIFMSRHTDGRMKLVVESVQYGLMVNPPGGRAYEFAGKDLFALTDEWAKVATLWNSASEPEAARTTLWETSSISRYGVALMLDLQKYGIEIPAAAEA